MLDPGHVTAEAQNPAAGVDLAEGPTTSGDHHASALGNSCAADQRNPVARSVCVGGIPFPTAIRLTTPGLEAPSGTTLPPTGEPPEPTMPASAATISDPGRQSHDAQRQSAGADLHDAILSILAASLDDLERTRIATQNRIRALRDDQGLAGSPFDAKLTALLEGLEGLEHQATLDLQRAMRMHPLHAFVKQTRGLGEKQAARLLAAIGDPAARENPAKLWQYAGHGDPARSRKRKGHVVEFNPTAKMRVHLCAESLLRSGNREVYDAARAAWVDRDTTDGHKHNHALRLVGKRLLLDMWKAARTAA